MPHVPFVMHMPKDYEWNRLSEHISSGNEENPVPSILTDNHNRNISFESQNNTTESKLEHIWSILMIMDNPSRVNNECRWRKKSGKASCMENEDNVLDFLDSSSCTAENKSSDKVNSTEKKAPS